MVVAEGLPGEFSERPDRQDPFGTVIGLQHLDQVREVLGVMLLTNSSQGGQSGSRIRRIQRFSG